MTKVQSALEKVDKVVTADQYVCLFVLIVLRPRGDWEAGGVIER